MAGSLQRSPDPLAGFKGSTSKGRGGDGRGGKRREMERGGEGRKGKREGGAPSARRAQGPQNTLRRLCITVVSVRLSILGNNELVMRLMEVG